MRSRVITIVILLLLIATFIGHKWILQRIQEGYAYNKSSIDAVHVMKELPHIESISDGDKDSVELNIVLNGKSLNRKIHIPYVDRPYSDSSKILVDKLYIDLHYQRQTRDVIHLIKSSIPISGSVGYSFEDFCSIDFLTDEDVQELEKELSKWNLNSYSNTVDKISRLALGITKNLRNDGSAVISHPANSSAWKLYCDGVSGFSRMTCGEFEQIFYAFANVAGVKTRRVGIVGRYPSDGNVKITGHHFNEVFIPEKNRWAYVDLSTDKLFLKNSRNEFLNTYQLWNAYISGMADNINIVSTRGDTLSTVPLAGNDANENYYFSPQSTIVYKKANDRYSAVGKIRRYLFDFDPSLGNFDTRKFYVKNAMVLLSLIFAVILFVRITKVIFVKLKLRS